MTDSIEQPTPPEDAQVSGEGTSAPPAVDGQEAAAAASGAVAADTGSAEADAVSPDASLDVTDSDATAPQFAELRPEPSAGGQGSLAMLYDLMMPVSVELGRTAMTVRDVLGLGRGSVIPLNRLAGEPIDIYVSDRKLAEGEVVVLGDHFGVRLTKVLPGGSAVSAGDLQAGVA